MSLKTEHNIFIKMLASFFLW